MEWTRSETLGLSTHSCVLCNGLGLRVSENCEDAAPCNCVLRNIFRACYARFCDISKQEKFLSQACLEAIQGRDGKRVWSRKDEEYVADFTLVARRSLSEADYQIFKYHFLLGADWKMCCGKLKMARGNFFHSVNRIQSKLGRVYRDVEPYALFPLSEYFHGEQKIVSSIRYTIEKVVPIRPPMRKVPPAALPSGLRIVASNSARTKLAA